MGHVICFKITSLPSREEPCGGMCQTLEKNSMLYSKLATLSSLMRGQNEERMPRSEF